MALNPDQLVTFARVAEAGSLSRAAETLRLTQPAVSNQMSRLSSAVGEPLFTRYRHGVLLTKAGTELLPHARAVVRAIEGATELVNGLRGLETGAVNIASSTTIGSYLLPTVLARYKKDHPGIRTNTFVGNTEEVVARLESGGAEVALVEGPVDRLPPGIERRLVRQDEIVLVTLPDHPLADREREPHELDGLKVVWREKGSGTREVAERALHGVRLESVLELVGSQAVKEAVSEGLGSAFLSQLVVEREMQAGILAATVVNAPRMTRSLTLLRPPLDLLSRACHAFLRALETTID
jgi:DNA-binding transcriptional LysR family regulator